jgi:hypothetical protein
MACEPMRQWRRHAPCAYSSPPVPRSPATSGPWWTPGGPRARRGPARRTGVDRRAQRPAQLRRRFAGDGRRALDRPARRLSVGAQATAVAAAASQLPDLVPVSPTVDPEARTAFRLLRCWLLGTRLEPLQLGREQAPDWARAGLRRLVRVVDSALTTPIEDHLPGFPGRLTVIHAEQDAITSHSYAAQLAVRGSLLLVPAPRTTGPTATRTASPTPSRSCDHHLRSTA